MLTGHDDDAAYASNSLNQYASVTENGGYTSYSYAANVNQTSDGHTKRDGRANVCVD